ncbi:MULTISPECIES: hypothetical protein [unclassified Nodularia (in: cyanobacteria)]|uniref:hypothetical protein n=1 Tax=unclassified Nodularia (in: cyanobacteria) TaxID=2656917 RepID=UPI00187F837F|nr:MULTISPECIES: hypothetical protein [unclassified Nodularia (in: cyanobacteria)]MBE9201561.1 hypothetical protein [Nodularia sp. LEGE 06071]MCC2694454.1 hypothetical protein [Nodularia sp. LEGE 04288]
MERLYNGWGKRMSLQRLGKKNVSTTVGEKECLYNGWGKRMFLQRLGKKHF